jgi:hypothetical protein
MAERRMFAKTIINSDAFLDMPPTAQSLYFHLSMRADDDGFVNNPKAIMRLASSSQSDLDTLSENKFIIYFTEGGIVAIKHWKLSNSIKMDRYTETKYKELKSKLSIDENGSYSLSRADTEQSGTELEPEWRQSGTELEPQVRLDQDSIDQDKFYIPGDSENDITDPEKLFLKIWQGTGDVFNITSRIESPKEWRHFWETSKITCEQVKIALENCIADVRSGEIEPHFVASMPDRFVLNGGIQRHQKRFKPQKTSPPHSGSQASKKSLF